MDMSTSDKNPNGRLKKSMRMDRIDNNNNNNNNRFKSMDMEHTVSAFALVFAASSISLILLFIEVINMIIIDPGNIEKHSKSALLS